MMEEVGDMDTGQSGTANQCPSKVSGAADSRRIKSQGVDVVVPDTLPSERVELMRKVTDAMEGLNSWGRRLEEEKEACAVENVRLREELDMAAKYKSTLENLNAGLMVSEESAQTRLKELEAKYQEQQEALQSLTEKFQSKEEELRRVESDRSLQARQAEADRILYSQQLHNAEAQHVAEQRDLEHQLEAKCVEVNQLRLELASHQADKASLSEETKALLEGKHRAEDALARTETHLGWKEKEVVKLKTDLRHRERELAEVTNLMAQMQNQHQELAEDGEQLRAEKAAFSSAMEEKNCAVLTLQKQLEGAMTKCRAMEDEMAEGANNEVMLKDQLRRLINDHAELKEETGRLSADKEVETSALKAELETLKEERHALQIDLQTREKDNELLTEKHLSEAVEWGSREDLLKTRVRELMGQIEDAERRQQELTHELSGRVAEKAVLHDAHEALRNEFQSLQRDMATLMEKNQVSEADRDTRESALQTQIDDLTARLEQGHRQLESVNLEKERLEEFAQEWDRDRLQYDVQLNSLRSSNVENEKRVLDLTGRLAEAERNRELECATLRTEKERTEKRVEELEEGERVWERRLGVASEALAECETEKAQSQAQVQGLLNDLAEANQECAALRTEKKRAEKQIEELTLQLNERQWEWEKARDTLAKCETEKAGAEARVQEISDRHGQLEQECVTLRTQKEGMEKRMEELTVKLDERQQDGEQMRDTLTKYETEKAQAEARVQELSDHVEEVERKRERECAALRTEKERAESQVEELTERLEEGQRDWKRRQEEAGDSLAKCEKAKAQAEGRVKELTERLHEAEQGWDELGRCQAEKTQAELRAEQLAKLLQEAETEREQASGDLANCRREKTQADLQLEESTERLRDAERKEEEMRTLLVTIQEQKAEAVKRQEELTGQLEQADGGRAELQLEKQLLEGEVAKLVHQIGESRKKIVDLSGRLETSNELTARLTEEKTTLNAQRADAVGQMEAMQARLSVLETDYNRRLDAAAREKAAIDQRLTAQAQRSESLEAEQAQYVKSLNERDSKIEKNREEMGSLRAKLSSQEAENAENVKQIASLRERLQQLESQERALKDEISEKNAYISELEGRISDSCRKHQIELEELHVRNEEIANQKRSLEQKLASVNNAEDTNRNSHDLTDHQKHKEGGVVTIREHHGQKSKVDGAVPKADAVDISCVKKDPSVTGDATEFKTPVNVNVAALKQLLSIVPDFMFLLKKNFNTPASPVKLAKTDARYKIALSSWKEPELQQLQRMIRKMPDTTIVSKPQDNSYDCAITHVICKPGTRTLTTFGASLTGAWIIVKAEEWIRGSFERGEWLKENEFGYQYAAQPFKGKAFYASEDYKKAAKNGGKAFKVDYLKSLIVVCGKGRIVDTWKEADYVLITDEERQRCDTLYPEKATLTWTDFINMVPQPP
ncbi:hypothetical protein HK104_006610 [Borealophlyctis nickersoniae]|nr:hypothetical protein HK104_006610 [Borealophlyctis nickersoniae]